LLTTYTAVYILWHVHSEKRRLTPAEYLAIEVASEGRHEFCDGEMFAMGGGSYWHNVSVERYRRQNADDPGAWVLTAVTDPAGVVDLESLGISVPVAEIYAGVEFPPPAR
jgi:Uma2 family endonuclease